MEIDEIIKQSERIRNNNNIPKYSFCIYKTKRMNIYCFKCLKNSNNVGNDIEISMI